MPTDENTNWVIPQNSNNSNQSNWWNNPDSNSVLDMDIDLNLDSVELPTRENNEKQQQQENYEVSNQILWNSENNDDWLEQEDKRVEELTQNDPAPVENEENADNENSDENVWTQVVENMINNPSDDEVYVEKNTENSENFVEPQESVDSQWVEWWSENDELPKSEIEDSFDFHLEKNENSDDESLASDEQNEQTEEFGKVSELGDEEVWEKTDQMDNDQSGEDLFDNNINLDTSNNSDDSNDEVELSNDSNNSDNLTNPNSLEFGSSEEWGSQDENNSWESNFTPHINLDFVSDTGAPAQEWQYVPNEEDYYKIYDALDSAPHWQINVSSLHDGTLEKKDDSKYNEIESQMNWWNDWVFNLDAVTADLQVQDLNSVIEKTKEENLFTNPNETSGAQNLWSVLSVDVHQNVVSDNTVASVPNVQQVSEVPQTSQNINTMPQPSVEQPQQNVVNNTVWWYVPSTQVSWQWQQLYVDQNGMWVPGTVVVSQEKNHHTWLKVILIFLLLLWAWIFILYKMFPSEFNDIIKAIKWEDTTVIEYSWWVSSSLEPTSTQTNSESLDSTEDMENLEMHGSADDAGISEELWDPNSLSALLEQDNQDIVMQPIDSETNEEVNNDGNDGEDMDVFWELWLLIDDDRSDILNVINVLESYEKQWETYQKLWSDQNQSTVYKYATYIVNKSKSMREDIETTWKMDINAINQVTAQFDSYLSKMATLVTQ